MKWNCSELIKSFPDVSSYDLFRIMTAVHDQLDDPERILEIKRRLHVGQEVSYYLPEKRQTQKAKIIKFLKDHALVESMDAEETWEVAFCAFDLSGLQSIEDAGVNQAHVGALEPTTSIGEDVWFLDAHKNEVGGKVVRLNERTATVACRGMHWRVAYDRLFTSSRLVQDAADFTHPPSEEASQESQSKKYDSLKVNNQ